VFHLKVIIHLIFIIWGEFAPYDFIQQVKLLQIPQVNLFLMIFVIILSLLLVLVPHEHILSYRLIQLEFRLIQLEFHFINLFFPLLFLIHSFLEHIKDVI